MASKFESGHFINLAQFQNLNTYLGSQASYAPDAPEIQLPQLTAFAQEVSTATDLLVQEAATLQQVVNDRQQLFAQSIKVARRVMNYLEATSTNQEAIKDVRVHFTDMLSKKVSKKQIVADDGSVSDKSYSSSRLSYHSIAENFQKMVERLATMPVYAPSDNTVQLATLNTAYASLHNINTQVNNQFVTVTNARNHRDQLMYGKDIGLVDRANRIKKYLKYKYGPQSDQYKFASKLIFRRKQIRTNDPIPNNPDER